MITHKQAAYDEALKRPEMCRQNPKRGTLDFDHLGLTKVPPEVAQITTIKTIRLRGNHFTSLPLKICRLIGLQELRVEDNQLSALPPEISQLIALTKLKGTEVASEEDAKKGR